MTSLLTLMNGPEISCIHPHYLGIQTNSKIRPGLCIKGDEGYLFGLPRFFKKSGGCGRRTQCFDDICYTNISFLELHLLD